MGRNNRDWQLGPDVPTAENWLAGERRRQSLKYTLGDYCFWQFRFEATVCDALLTALIERRGNLVQIAENEGAASGILVIRSCPAQERLARLRFAGGRLRYVPHQYPRYYVEFTGTFKDYLAKFSAKSRSTWQRKVRKFTAQSGGTIDWRRYTTPAEMSAFHALASELSKKTYQERIFQEGFASSAGADEKVVALAGRGQVRGYILFLRGEPAAYAYCHCAGDTIVYSVLGYDQSFRELSPGDVLLFLIIEALFGERAFRYMDFGEGVNWYKEFYSTGAARCARVYYFPKTFKNVAAVVLHAGTNALSDALGRALDTLKLRERIRRLVRRTAVARGTPSKSAAYQD